MIGPSRLYKFKPFNAETLDLLNNREVYFPKPSTFNDPLDCVPILVPDADVGQMERLLAHVEGWRWDDAATQNKFAKVRAWARGDDRNDDFASDPLDPERIYRNEVARRLSDWLRSRFDTHGVLCLASNWDSPLLWSHYADAHRGLCIEFDNDDQACSELRKVEYDQPRGVRVSDLIDWQQRDSGAAEDRVRMALLGTKAKAWEYEGEWRAISDRIGLVHSPFEISAVHFGMKCPQHVRTAVIALMHGALPKVEFYDVRPAAGSFRLTRSLLEPNEELCYGPHPSARRIFAKYAQPEPTDGKPSLMADDPVPLL